MKNENYVKHVETKLNFSDLVLPINVIAQINEINIDWKQMNGIFNALFLGVSGTGKTLVASLLGKANNKAVWEINAKTIISNYVNETEASLEHILTKAVASNAFLFFDEADALFGKRSDVKDSHDKYANLEANFILEKLESRKLSAVFSASQKSNLDESFLRRMRYLIEFPVPNNQERLPLWKQSLAKNIKLADDVNLTEIANNYILTGGSIQNVIRKTVIASSGSITKASLDKHADAELRKIKSQSPPN